MCDKSIDVCAVRESGERGIALVTVLLITSLVLALIMGISLTAISEAGVGNTYANQERAFQAAEGGLYHALSLVKNYSNGAAGDPTFTKLLAMRDFPTAAEKSLAEYRFPKPLNYLDHYNPFTDASLFSTGCSMITYEVDASGKTLGHQLTDADGNLVPGAYYTIHVIDDEPFVAGQDVTKPWVPNFNPPASPAWESGDHNTDVDTNNRLVVYSTGTYGSASVTLEGWIGFIPYPALVAQEDITVWGNSQINGAYGGVHSNDNLAVGASAYIEQTATAVNNFTQSGSSDIQGFHAGGQPALYIPKFVTTDPTTSGGPKTSPRLQDYVIRRADTLLIDPGYRDPLVDAQGRTGQQRSDELAARLNVDATQLWTAINSTGSENAITITRSCSTCAGTVATASVSGTGWKYNNSSGWDIQGSEVKNHTFYVLGMDNYKISNPSSSKQNGGNVKVTSNVGTDIDPVHISIFATGSIEIDGTPNLVANVTGLGTTELPPFVTINSLLMSVEDVKIRGDAGVPKFSGVVYAGEQFDLSGNGSFDGQIISLSNQDINGSPVKANSVSGSFDLTFNGGQAIGKVKLMSWRQIKL